MGRCIEAAPRCSCGSLLSTPSEQRFHQCLDCRLRLSPLSLPHSRWSTQQLEYRIACNAFENAEREVEEQAGDGDEHSSTARIQKAMLALLALEDAEDMLLTWAARVFEQDPRFRHDLQFLKNILFSRNPVMRSKALALVMNLDPRSFDIRLDVLPEKSERGEEIVHTFKEAMDFLRVSRSTLLRMMQSGEISGHKVGCTWRFYHRDLIACICQVPILTP